MSAVVCAGGVAGAYAALKPAAPTIHTATGENFAESLAAGGSSSAPIEMPGGVSIVLSVKWPWYAPLAQSAAQGVARVCWFFGLPYMWAAWLAGKAIIAGAKFEAERQ